MAVRNMVLWPAVILLWMSLWEATCDTQHQAEEEELFVSDKQTSLKWTSDPARQWVGIHLSIGTVSPVPVLQACGRPVTRTVLSPWMERKEANHLFMDIAFVQQEEPSGELSPLQVHLFDSDTPITRFRNGWKVLDLKTSTPFHTDVPLNQYSNYLNHSRGLSLGPVSRRGFQLAFSYSGKCVFVTSVRLYYKKCPAITSELVSFKGTGGGSDPVTGSCVEGAVETSTPVRECDASGVWGQMQGGCVCEPGHQVVEDTCQACSIGYYKPVNESGACRLCPPNSRTHGEGSVRCECLQGFTRLSADPHDYGCTKPPSAPLNLTALHHNDSLLIMTWDPPHDLGGRQEVTYRIVCEKLTADGGQWGKCGNDVVFLPDSTELNGTLVVIDGLDPQWDYRLSVQAWNDVSNLQGAPPSSTATVTIQRWKVPPPAVITVSPGLDVTEHFETIAAPQHSRFPMWLSVGVLFTILLLMALIPIAVCICRQNYTKIRSAQEEELLPMNPVFSYRRQQEPEEEEEAPPQQMNMVEGVESMAQMLEGLGGRLLHSLREVLVERNTLTLGKELGKGEFGSVFEGLFTPAEGEDIKVAVKTMKVGIHSQEDLCDFLREAEIMKNFDHENVVGLLGVTLQREQDSPLPVPLVILPYMKHGDLRRFLIATRYGDLPMFVPHQSLLRFMIDIAAGMDYLTLQGFVHRDLAARNCMLGDDLRVRVADFGLSKKIYSSNYYRQKVVVRLPIKWMAMESLAESVYTNKSDVWSFGVTMWEIVSRGKTPYPGVHNFELLELLQSGHRLKPPSDCDRKLYEVMRSCWDQEPSCRPGFRDLGERLKDLLMELPVLEAEQEATYINQGLEAAAAVAACQDTQQEYRGRLENLYLPTPMGAAAARDEDLDVEDGYLKCIPDLVSNGDQDQ